VPVITPVILAKEAEIRSIMVPIQLKEFKRPNLKNTQYKKGLVE
jgi:hypothetical protein